MCAGRDQALTLLKTFSPVVATVIAALCEIQLGSREWEESGVGKGGSDGTAARLWMLIQKNRIKINQPYGGHWQTSLSTKELMNATAVFPFQCLGIIWEKHAMAGEHFPAEPAFTLHRLSPQIASSVSTVMQHSLCCPVYIFINWLQATTC